jgi:hypothetical protein
MDVPIFVAIITGSATLLGTITGGVIVGYGNVYLAKRREKLEFRTACRLVAAELQIAHQTVKFALDAHRWWRPDEELTMDAWKQYKNVLAPHLSYEAWSDVWLAVGNLSKANLLAAAPRPQNASADVLLPETENALTILLASFETGRAALRPHLL